MCSEKQTVQQTESIGINPSPASSSTGNIPPYTPPANANQSRLKGIKTSLLDLVAPIAGYLTVFFLIHSIFNSSNGFGITAAYLCFLGFTTVYIVSRHKVFPKKAIFPLCLCVLTSLSYSFYNIGDNLVSIPFLFYFSGLYCMNLTCEQGADFKGYMSLYRQLQAILSVPFSKLFLPIIALFQNRKASKEKKNFGVLIGVICGLPVFIIVANLLIQGDAAFSKLMNGVIESITELIYDFFSEIDAFSLVSSLFFTPYIVATIFVFRHGIVKEKLSQSTPDETVKHFRFASSGVLNGFYGVVAACYIIYLFSQLSYLFGAFSNSFTVSLSTYARRGFFEMSAVAFINLLLIGAGAILSKRDEKGNLPRSYKLFSLFFCLFTMLLITTAMSKMGLYIQELGLTHKRIQVFLADIVLFIAFLCILIKVFKKRFPYMQITLYTCISLICLYFVVSPDTLIAKFNTWAYLSGNHTKVDISEIAYLDNEYQALVNLDKLAQCDDTTVANEAKGEVYRIYKNCTSTASEDDYYYYDYENLCISRLRAKNYCVQNNERLTSYSKYAYTSFYDFEEDYPVATSNFTATYIYLEFENSKQIKSIVFENEIAKVSLEKESGDAMEYSDTADFDWVYKQDSESHATVTVTEENGTEHILKLLFSEEKDPDTSDNVIFIDCDYYSYDLVLTDGANGTLMIEENSYYW